MPFLKLIPIKYWVLLGVVLVLGASMRICFNRGVEAGRQEVEKAYELASKKALDESLTEVQGRLEAALERQRSGLKAIEELNLKYAETKQTKDKLQQDLDDAVNNPPDCNQLDPRYFRLYQSMYNQSAP